MKYIDEFINYLNNVKKYSNYTIINYRNDINKFIFFLKENGIDFNKVDYNTIRNFISYLYNLGETNKTIVRNISALRSFYKYLTRNNYIKDNPMLLISNPKL